MSNQIMNTNQTETGERPPARVRYSGKCYAQNRHWHLDMRGRWTYHNDVKCAECKNADQRYNIEA
jgi:hypothetical protein